jgi:hypothetical protein
MLRQREIDVAQQILDYLRLRGWRVHRLEADIYGPRARVKREEIGTPDYIAVRQCAGPGSQCDVWYIEVKRPGGKLRRSQQIWIEDARRRGWQVAVASSIDDLLAAGMPGLDDTPLDIAFERLRARLGPPITGRINPVELMRELREE